MDFWTLDEENNSINDTNETPEEDYPGPEYPVPPDFLMMAACWLVLVVHIGLFIDLFRSEKRRSRILRGRGSFRWECLSSHHVTHSSRECLSPMTFGILRLALSAMIFGAYVGNSRRRMLLGQNPFLQLIFFTNWSYFMQGVYFAVVGFCSVTRGGGEPRPADNLERFAWVLYQVMLPVSFMITLIYWAVLAPPSLAAHGWNSRSLGWFSIMSHIGNLLNMILETSMNRFDFYRSHMLFAGMYSLTYTVFQWFGFLVTGRTPYWFLQYWRPTTPIVYMVLMWVLIGIYTFSEKCLGPLAKCGAKRDLAFLLQNADDGNLELAPPSNKEELLS